MKEIDYKKILQEDYEEWEDGWGDEVREIMDELLSLTDSLAYEIRNCVRGAYTGCKTREDLIDYLRNKLSVVIDETADELE